MEEESITPLDSQNSLDEPNFVKLAWKGGATPWKVWLIGFVGGRVLNLLNNGPNITLLSSLIALACWFIFSVWAIVSLWRCATPAKTNLFVLYRGSIILTITVIILRFFASLY